MTPYPPERHIFFERPQSVSRSLDKFTVKKGQKFTLLLKNGSKIQNLLLSNRVVFCEFQGSHHERLISQSVELEKKPWVRVKRD